jgi:quaternary ammonium compound-resistance protein SugE
LAWVLLIVAGLFEVSGAILLKLTDGFRRMAFVVPTLLAFAVSVFLLSIAAETLPIGTAYAVWTGIGAAGTAVIGMAAFRESTSVARLLSLMLVIAGAAGMKLFA